MAVGATALARGAGKAIDVVKTWGAALRQHVKIPHAVGVTQGGAYGQTDMLGNITISPHTPASEVAPTLRHEFVHRLLSPVL